MDSEIQMMYHRGIEAIKEIEDKLISVGIINNQSEELFEIVGGGR